MKKRSRWDDYEKHYNVRLYNPVDGTRKEYAQSFYTEEQERRFLRLIGIHHKKGFLVIEWLEWWEPTIPF